MEILSGTFSEYQTLFQAKESDSTCWILPSLIPCITMVWRFYAFQTKANRMKESAGTELARTLIIIRMHISERTIGSTNDYIIHSLLPGHFSMLMTNSFSLIASHIPTLICRKIWAESKETPIHQTIIIEERLRGHWLGISANTYQSPRKTKTPRARKLCLKRAFSWAPGCTQERAMPRGWWRASLIFSPVMLQRLERCETTLSLKLCQFSIQMVW